MVTARVKFMKPSILGHFGTLSSKVVDTQSVAGTNLQLRYIGKSILTTSLFDDGKISSVLYMGRRVRKSFVFRT